MPTEPIVKDTRGPTNPGKSPLLSSICVSAESPYDHEGTRLCTRRMARMPEGNKRTLKAPLAAEVTAALTSRPDLHLVKVADGASDTWTYLTESAAS